MGYVISLALAQLQVVFYMLQIYVAKNVRKKSVKLAENVGKLIQYFLTIVRFLDLSG